MKRSAPWIATFGIVVALIGCAPASWSDQKPPESGMKNLGKAADNAFRSVGNKISAPTWPK
jgi:hypothetical protein